MSVVLSPNTVMTVTASAFQGGSYWLLNNPGDRPGSNVEVSAGSSVEIGPFSDVKVYQLNKLSYVIANEQPYDDDRLTAVETKTEFLQGVQATFIDDIAVDATGTAIATAVNAILAALLANGLMAEEVI